MSTKDNTLTPETITDQPFSAETVPFDESSSGTNKTDVTPAEIKPSAFRRPVIAQEVIAESLNSQSRRILGAFEFGQLGALQIGKYENGVSGDIRLTPNGLVARDANGNNTVSIDGTTGDATFKGQIRAGSFVTNGDVTISGTGAFVVNDGTYNVIRLGYGSGLF